MPPVRSLSAVLLLALLLAGGAGAQPARGSREQELEAVRLEIVRLQGRLDRLRDEAAGLTGQLERSRVELALQEQRLAEAEAARALADERLQRATAAVKAVEGEVAAVQRELRSRMFALYRLGRPGYLRLFLAARPGTDLLPALRQLRFFARRDGQLLARFTEARARLGFERDQLAEQERVAAAWVTREEERRRELDAARERQRLLLAAAEREQRLLSGRADELAERERKLANFLDFLYGRSDPLASGRSIRDFRGLLERPVAGAVTVPFGPRRDRRYGTTTPHHGVEMSTAAGAEVRAVFAGRVAFAAPFEGYGPTVVLQHTGGVFTLYAGLSELRVARGDVVALHAPLGAAGERLYFEIRVDNRPEDPLSWIR